MLRKPEWAMKNRESRDIGNIGQIKKQLKKQKPKNKKQTKNKQSTTQHNIT